MDKDAEIARLQEEVDHYRVKAKCYGNIVHGCSPALASAGFPVDASNQDGAVGGIKRAVEAMSAEIARLKAALEKERKFRREATELLSGFFDGDDIAPSAAVLLAYEGDLDEAESAERAAQEKP